MLYSPQEKVWIMYAVLLACLNLYLTLRIRKNLLLIPFLVFGVLVTIGTICLLANNSGVFQSASNSVNPVFIGDRYWQDQSLSLSVLPTASVLLLFGIMEAQLIFIRHMAVAIHNRDHWGSIYLRDPEKSQGFLTAQKKKKSSLRPWTYWASLILMVLYLCTAICSFVIQTMDHDTKGLGVAVCVSVLCLLACFNVGVILFSCNSSANHIRTIRKNRDDLMFLRFTPVLFLVLMMGMTVISWVSYLQIDGINMAAWISIETLTVYLPLMLILIMCIYTGKIQTMGRQYPIEVAQQQQNKRVYPQKQMYSYQTVRDMETVTKKLSFYEVNKVIPTPPPATYSNH
ncbi:hypothetical protein INT47_005094 [Mucor saturninus]|uniref:Uncharacterized protein n=1 Tax=Mucor saturninus TaxID=64648 RepID=A0A8H7QVM9_9FUNG|nr:hypothetical protein INT47_005094 [Mucor saturninus]